MIREAIAKAVERKDLSADEMSGAMEEIMTGGATPAQVGAFLIALRMKGETPEEIMGGASVMRNKVVKVRAPEGATAMDLCGTGGDRAHTFNISTAAAVVTAGAGVCVAKHGNRAVSSNCGSADVLEALGVKLDAPPESAEKSMREAGMAFLFAPRYHPAMKHAIGPRREIGQRTIFNILGPLTNPAGVKRQLLGVHDAGLMRLLAEGFKLLGSERILLVHGKDGLDEASLSDETVVTELDSGEIREWTFAPEDAGLKRASKDALRGGTPDENAAAMKKLLKGDKNALRDVTVLNSACALMAAGRAGDLREGARLAQGSIDSGSALKVLEGLVRFSAEA